MAKTASSTGMSPKPAPPAWSPLSGTEVEELVAKLARDGKPGSLIGVVLRDQYAVPDVRAATGKTLSEILKANSLAPQIPEDLQSLIKRTLELREHLADHSRDLHNRRALECMESRIRRLAKYYKRTDVLPYDWKYTEETAKLLAE